MSHRYLNITLHCMEPVGRKAAIRRMRNTLCNRPPLTSFWRI